MLDRIPVDVLRIAVLLAVALIFGGVAFFVGLQPVTEATRLGNRGLRRKLAIQEGGLFATFEPLIRFIATWVGRLRIPQLRRVLEDKIIHSGEWLGLTPDEFIAMTILSTVGFSAFGAAVVSYMKLQPIYYLLGPVIGYMLPRSKLDNEVAMRFKQIDRTLPIAIDLAALCMGAGLDFPASLRQYVEKGGMRDALYEEFVRILQELELGRTRKQALENFATRAPTDAVQDFVSSVVQAEEKGNPLAEVLRIQATMLRMRRSVMAEEAAARAAVMLLMPLMLIFGAIILILMGPFIIQGMSVSL